MPAIAMSNSTSFLVESGTQYPSLLKDQPRLTCILIVVLLFLLVVMCDVPVLYDCGLELTTFS